MGWFSSLFGGGRDKGAGRAAAQANEDNKEAMQRQEALMREQMQAQKEYQMDLTEESARVAAAEAEFRSRYRREGMFGTGSFQEYGRFGGFMHGNERVVQGTAGIARENAASYVAQTMGATPSERSSIPWWGQRGKDLRFQQPGHTQADVNRAQTIFFGSLWG